MMTLPKKKTGREGRRIQVVTNCFSLSNFPSIPTIYHYDLVLTKEGAAADFSPSPKLLSKVFCEFTAKFSRDIGNVKPVFDGKKNVYSSQRLPFGKQETFPIQLPGERTKFLLKLQLVNEISLAELGSFIEGNGEFNSTCQTAIQALDVLLRYKPSLTHPMIGKSFFSKSGFAPIAGGLEAWQGHFQSLRMAQGRLVVNVDTACSVFYAAGPVIELVTKVLQCSVEHLRRGLSSDERTQLLKVIKGVEFITEHRGSKTKGKKIFDITREPAYKVMFQQKDGKEISVADYFKEFYGINLKFDYLPCIKIQKGHCFPMEVCTVVDNQKYPRTKKISDVQTSDILKLATVPPQDRFKKIENGIATLKYDDNEYLHQFGFSVDSRPINTDARILDTPEIIYNKTSQEPVVKPGMGMRNMRGKKLVRGGTLDTWGVAVFASKNEVRNGQTIERFLGDFTKACETMDLKILNPTPPIIYGDSRGGYEQTLKKAFISASEAAGGIPPRLLLCVLPRKDKSLYGNIKKITDTIIGLPSQCVVLDHFRNKPANINYLCNVILKVNVKLGGVNCFLRPDSLPFLSEEPSMIMGADVSHYGLGQTSPSIASVVATIDARASRYASALRYQPPGQEMINEMEGMTMELLRHFYRNTGHRPNRILMYRDGVSEGQFQEVLNSEAKAILSGCEKIEAGYRPKLTFVVIQKRHHVRFYPTSSRDGDKLGNCPPGTVVDTGITHPTEYDFYLQSHSSLKGTARPAKYHVLMDQNDIGADELQQLTFNLCYLFARSTASVSMATPAYYADILCMRGNFHRRDFGETSTISDGLEVDFDPVKSKLHECMYFL